MNAFQKEIEKAGTSLAKMVGTEAEGIRAFREYNDQARRNDPTKVAWPNTLAIELALKTATPQELRVHYGFTDEEWTALRNTPAFIAELAEKVDLVKQEGMSFRLKCQLQSEALLETNWKLIHAPMSEVPAATKQKLMEAIWRMAGYDTKDTAAAGGGSSFAIQINLN